MQNLTIRTKLFTAVFALLALFLLTVGLVYRSNQRIKNSSAETERVVGWLEDLGEAELHAERLLFLDKSMVAAAYARDGEQFERHAREVEEVVKTVAETNVPRLQADMREPAAIADLRAFADGLRGWHEALAQVEAAARAGRPDDAQQLSKTKSRPLMEANVELLLKVEKGIKEEARRDIEADHAAIDQLAMTLTSVLLLAFVVGGVVLLTVRGISRTLGSIAATLTEGASQVAAASSQVSGSAQSLSQGATEQAASLEETSASMVEMSSTTRQNAEHTHQAASLVGEVDSRVSQSNTALGRMVRSMNEIQESSSRVGKIIRTIDEIAFQTNILALNAAVEAARAGEAGMGFAVVADEVRSLAQRSAQAAKDTATLIEEAIANAAQGTRHVDEVATAIADITGSVQRVKGLVGEISIASRQQSEGIDQVTEAVSQMEKVTQSIAATAEESAAASEELNAQAETTRSAVEALQAMVGGANGAPSLAARAGGPGAGRRTSPVLSFARRPASGTSSSEDVIPLETGTFAKF